MRLKVCGCRPLMRFMVQGPIRSFLGRRRPNSVLAGLGAKLFDPSPLLISVAERRQARLLAKLQFAHVVQLCLGILMLVTQPAGVMPPGMRTTIPIATVGVAIAYGFSRTRFIRFSIWLYVVVAASISPLTLLSARATGPLAVLHPVLALCYLLPPVLLVSSMSSARATVATGLLAFGSCLAAMLVAHNYSPADEAVKQGSMFFLTAVTLVVIFSIHRDNIQKDRAAELRTRNEELETLRRTLEDKVAERTVALSTRNADMRFVLDHVAQGIFTLDRSGRMSPECSAVLSKWFGQVQAGDLIHQYFGRVSAEFGENLEIAWQQVVDDVLPVEVTLDQMPKVLVAGDRHYRFSYGLIAGDTAGRLIVVISDVTSEVERERAQREKQETLAVFEHVLADRHGFVQFMDEGSEWVARVREAVGIGPELKRALHTLKGNAALMGLHSISELCHQAESRLADEGVLATEDLTALCERWMRLRSDVDILMGSRKHVIEISPERHRVLERAVAGAVPLEELARLVRELRLEPVDGRLQYFADHVRRLATRLNKQVEVDVQGGGLYLDERPWSQLWTSFVHAVRNAVDHGIESPAERRAVGKADEGRVVLRARLDGMNAVLEIQDDGRGIDWDRIRACCAAKGLPVTSQEDLCAALFTGGISTAAHVTDISGRGVGMGALHASVRALGGRLRVSSEPGRGTLLRMEFPLTPHSNPPWVQARTIAQT